MPADSPGWRTYGAVVELLEIELCSLQIRNQELTEELQAERERYRALVNSLEDAVREKILGQ